MIMEKFLIKNKRFVHDEEIITGLNYMQETSLGINFHNRNLNFKLALVTETADFYKQHLFSPLKIKKKTGLRFSFCKPTLDDDKGIDDVSIEEVRCFAKLACYTQDIIILYEYETGNWYLDGYNKRIDYDDYVQVISALVDKIIDLCIKE